MSEDFLPTELHERRFALQSGIVDDDTDVGEPIELPGADLSSLRGVDVELRVRPKQHDEFTCSSCFLVLHRSRLAKEARTRLRCRDCV